MPQLFSQHCGLAWLLLKIAGQITNKIDSGQPPLLSRLALVLPICEVRASHNITRLLGSLVQTGELLESITRKRNALQIAYVNIYKNLSSQLYEQILIWSNLKRLNWARWKLRRKRQSCLYLALHTMNLRLKTKTAQFRQCNGWETDAQCSSGAAYRETAC